MYPKLHGRNRNRASHRDTLWFECSFGLCIAKIHHQDTTNVQDQDQDQDQNQQTTMVSVFVSQNSLLDIVENWNVWTQSAYLST